MTPQTRYKWIASLAFVALVFGASLLLVNHSDGNEQRAISIAASASPPADTLLRGTVTAPVCGGGYALVGAAVLVQDEHGTVIGSGMTGRADTAADGTHAICTVHFAVPLVHKASFYQIHVGTHGAPTYSYDQLTVLGFRVDLTLQ